jgi:SAM-dependent methyltransferase
MTPDPSEYAKSIGYSEQEIRSIPEGIVCRGCGNPTALAELREGETVLDLGSGEGLDAFLAARRVGATGKVIGVDASAEAVAKATQNAAKGGYANVVFEQGEMENLPLDDESVDVVISNCVLNHAAGKLAAFREAYRCLRPNGRMVVMDLVVEGAFSDEMLHDRLWGGWLAAAAGKRDYLKTIEKAGFREVLLVDETTFAMAESDERLRGKIVSIALRARK